MRPRHLAAPADPAWRAACRRRQAAAQEVEITASFIPDIRNPTRNEFVNTTPNAPLCFQRPDACGHRPGVGIPLEVDFVPAGSLEYLRDLRLRFPDGRLGGPYKVKVTHTETGQTAILDWAATMVAGTYILPRSIREIIPDAGGQSNEQLHAQLWDRSWFYAPEACGFSSYGIAGDTDYSWAWQLNGNHVECGKIFQHELESMRIRDLVMAYQLTAPEPFTMANGTYTGKLWIITGNAGEFWFGGDSVANMPMLGLNFTLEVNHYFDVRFPAGSSTLWLQPEGGWQRWVDYHERPSALVNDLRFDVTTSTGFTVQARCGVQSGNDCGLRRADDGSVVPMQIDLSVPGMAERNSARPVRRTPVPTQHGGQPALDLEVHEFIVNRPSNLRFMVQGQPLDTMLDAPGVEWSGDVTVVFDADP